MALLGLIAAQARGQEVHALIVDHGLRDSSRNESEITAQRCADMGARARVLTWDPPPLSSAIQEQARKARYALMGQACREIGANSLFVGHTEDDQAETMAIRQDCGAHWRGLAGIAPRAYAPVWPALYNITLVRPLLHLSRAALRDYNTEKGIEWIEDPSNDSDIYQRVRMRKALASDADMRVNMLRLCAQNRGRVSEEERAVSALLKGVAVGSGAQLGADIHIPRAHISKPHFDRLLGQIILCASGRAHRPDMKAVSRLASAMMQTEFKPATLSGAVIAPRTGGFVVAREAGRWLKRSHAVPLHAGVATVFDGRFTVRVDGEGFAVSPLWPLRTQLEGGVKSRVKALSAYERRSALAIIKDDRVVCAPQLGYKTCTEAVICEDLRYKRLENM